MESPDSTRGGPGQPQDEPGSRRDPAKGREGDRRRGNWRDFRQSYPGFVFTLILALLAILMLDGFLVYKRRAYTEEVNRLRGAMTEAERERTDAIVQAEQDKARIAIELAKRQAKLEKSLHLGVALDSGRIYLEREGAVLREMAALFGPEVGVTPGSDSLPVVIPRGQRTVVRLDENRIVLEGGSAIEAASTDVASTDTSPIPAGNVRIGLTDMKAIRPNLSRGMRVYFY
ncbi:MAG TPA: hypothetical protein VES88_03680 [Gemmatimonadaceae bacterium]|nr:hypothetical protein [Gemmatimonadaceae bacterium]